METKKCSKCREVKPVYDFNKRKDSKDGYRNECKLCQIELYNKRNIIRIEKRESIQEAKRILIENGLKQCSTCSKIKPLRYFIKSKDKKDGYSSQCKSCVKVRMEKNKKIYAKVRKEYYINNKDKIQKASKKWRDSHKEYLKEKHREWREGNKEYINIKAKENYHKNKEKRREIINTRRNKKMKTDINFALSRKLRTRISNAIKKGYKSGSGLELIGCTIPELWVHLESQFTEGMTKKNHNLHGWHIDHIKPCESFDLTDPEQQKECFHYTNLQPLWATDNLSKGAKWEE